MEINQTSLSMSVQASPTKCVQTGPSVQCTHRTVCEQSSSELEIRTPTVSEHQNGCIQTVIRTPTECVVCTKNEQCDHNTTLDDTSQAKPSTAPSFQVAGRKVKAKFKLSKIEGGRFSLKMNSTEKRNVEGASLEHNIVSDSYFSSSFQSFISARDKFRGEKCENAKCENESFNNISIIKTPKRKSDSSVAILIGNFSANTCELPEGRLCSESPAKRRRLWGHGGQGH